MKRLTTLALAFLLSGCSLSLPFSGPTRQVEYYVLTSPVSAGKEMASPRIGVLPLSMPGYLTRPQLVVRESDGVNIRVLDFDRWGEEIGQGVSRVLCDALSAEGISAVPLRTGSQVDAKLMLDVRRFDGSLDGVVILDAVWTLQKGKTVCQTGHTIKELPCGESLESMVETQSRLIQELARDIARSMR